MASTAAFVPQPPSAHTHPGTEHGGARLTWAASATAAASPPVDWAPAPPRGTSTSMLSVTVVAMLAKPTMTV